MVNTDTTPLAPFPFGKFIAIVLLAVLGTVLGAVLLSTHAVKRHGTEAQTIRDCLERNGAIQVWQMVQGVFVCCEEWLMNNDVNSEGHGGFEGILHDVIAEYSDGDPNKNKPRRVYIGHDVNTKGQIVGRSASQILAKIGWDWTFPAGMLSGKDIQRGHAIQLMWQNRIAVAASKNSLGQYVIAKQHFGIGKKRGILECMKRDVYPTEKGMIFDKDKSGSNPKSSIEDDRDAMLYGLICHIHPDTLDASYFKG